LLALSAAVSIMGAPIALADAQDMVPAVPRAIQVPAGNTVFLVRHAVGTQDYVCVASGSDFKFVLVTPRAGLFDDEGQQVTAHYFSPNPFEGGTVRATWEDVRDNGMVWGQAIQTSTDADYVAAGAIAWVLLGAVGANAEGSFAPTTYIQRLNTTGGAAPSTGCSSAADIGSPAFVSYTADYVFYEGGA
jgi:hypothetical protein